MFNKKKIYLLLRVALLVFIMVIFVELLFENKINYGSTQNKIKNYVNIQNKIIINKINKCDIIRNTTQNPVPIQFIHVPKCGGTSITKYFRKLSRHYGFIVYRRDGCNFLPNNATTYNNSKTVYMGHKTFGFNDVLVKHETIKIIVLRDPIKRLISQYDYVTYNKLKGRRGVKLPLNAIINKYRKNKLTYYYRKFMDELMYRHSSLKYLIFNGKYCNYTNIDPSGMEDIYNIIEDNEYLYNISLNNLKKIDIIGINKNISNIIIQLKFIDKRFNGINLSKSKIPHSNSHKKNKSYISKKNIFWLQKKLKYQIKIYNDAVKLESIKTNISRECLGL